MGIVFMSGGCGGGIGMGQGDFNRLVGRWEIQQDTWSGSVAAGGGFNNVDALMVGYFTVLDARHTPNALGHGTADVESHFWFFERGTNNELWDIGGYMGDTSVTSNASNHFRILHDADGAFNLTLHSDNEATVIFTAGTLMNATFRVIRHNL